VNNSILDLIQLRIEHSECVTSLVRYLGNKVKFPLVLKPILSPDAGDRTIMIGAARLENEGGG
jgi:hypothetical protein